MVLLFEDEERTMPSAFELALLLVRVLLFEETSMSMPCWMFEFAVLLVRVLFEDP